MEQTGTAPIISHSFASPQISPGRTWKVYLNAYHLPGGMKAIYCTLRQPGVGIYPVSILRVPRDQRREMSGYVFLNTAALRGSGSSNLSLTVQIQDAAGNFSEPACFDLSLNPLAEEDGPPPGVFRESEIGPVMIDVKPGPAGG